MTQMEETNHLLREARRKSVLSLAVNGLVPLIVYTLSRHFFTNDTTALAIAGAIPAVWIIALWGWRRRVDWIGVLAVFGYIVAFAVSAFSGWGSLPLKIHGSLLTGTIGLVFLISAVMRKPLLLPLLQVFTRSDPERSSFFETVSSNPASYRKFTVLTGVIGFVLLSDAVVYIILALTLSTGTFLVISRVVHWVILGGGALVLWRMRRRNQQD
jgi:hypothetical protein